MDIEKLFDAAKAVCQNAYAPYSKFRVGAALLSKDGELFTGVNVENRSFGLTNCAERSALYQAISKGVKEFETIVIHCEDTEDLITPCGACRQVLSEFLGPDAMVHFQSAKGKRGKATMSELLPKDGLYFLREDHS
jgi:cytidine deaminase